VDKDLRASVIAAIAAAALSALIGLIAGVNFLMLLLRALVCGLVAGGALYGAILLLRKMVPEVLSPESARPEAVDSLEAASGQGDSAQRAGSNLDIVLPGDEGAPNLLSPDDSASLPGRASGRASGLASDEIDDSSLLEPDIPPSDARPSAASHNASGALSHNAAYEAPARPSSGFDELDVLPDLEGFADTFTSSEFSSGGGAENARLPSGGGDSPSGGGTGMDPAAIAQAVRTILKRDQKG
jgi:hypothetical protein